MVFGQTSPTGVQMNRWQGAPCRGSSSHYCFASQRSQSLPQFSIRVCSARPLSSADIFRQSEAKMKAAIKSPPVMGGIICPDASRRGQNRRLRESAEGKDTKHVRIRLSTARSDISDFHRDRALQATAQKYARERTDLSSP
jgi:hypothetical protein